MTRQSKSDPAKSDPAKSDPTKSTRPETTRRPDRPRDETDMANDIMGDNALQGDDQSNVRNERHAVPGAKDADENLMETFEKTDKDVRARRDLGKGARSSGNSVRPERDEGRDNKPERDEERDNNKD